MPRPLRLAPVAVALLAALASTTGAQERPPTDTLPVRAGTWAAEGGVGGYGGGGNVAALRFLNGRDALAAQLFAQHSSNSNDDPFSLIPGRSSTSVTATLGWRRYGRVRRSLAPFGGVGALIGYSRQSSGRTEANVNPGAYGELGAAYVVSSRLALNASTGVQVLRFTSSFLVGNGTSEPRRVRQTDWSSTLGGARISATLFF